MVAGDVTAFDRFARYYDLVMPGASVGSLEAGLALAERPIERLVDLGGGTGRAAIALDVSERIVLDAAAGMLRRARGRGLDAVRGDATRLPLAENSVDAVVVVDALHHMYDWPAVFESVSRVLAPGGVFVVSDFDPTTLLGRGLVAAERLVGFRSQFSDPTGLVAQLGEVGFVPSVVEDGFAYTVAAVAPKQELK